MPLFGVEAACTLTPKDRLSCRAVFNGFFATNRQTRLDSWRGAYSDWRRGGSHGACGGVEDAVTRVVAPQGRLMPMPEYESLLNVKKIEDAPQKEKNCSFATAVLEVKNTGIRHQRCAFLPPIS